ncbi:MAG: hypothetical protein QXG48_00675 [Thermofilaceae archaeon]
MELHPLEELFRGSRKTLRILRVLFTAQTPLTKYSIESQAALYNAGAVLKRLERIGVVKALGERPKRYVLNRSNQLVSAIEKMMREVNYIP